MNLKLLQKLLKESKSNSNQHTYNCNYMNKAFGGDILWTNPNPSSDYGANSVSIANLNDYDIIKIVYQGSTNTTLQLETNAYLINNSCYVLAAFNDGTDYLRVVTIDKSSNKITFGRAQTPGVAFHDNSIIPLYVIGYKNGLFN